MQPRTLSFEILFYQKTQSKNLFLHYIDIELRFQEKICIVFKISEHTEGILPSKTDVSQERSTCHKAGLQRMQPYLFFSTLTHDGEVALMQLRGRTSQVQESRGSALVQAAVVVVDWGRSLRFENQDSNVAASYGCRARSGQRIPFGQATARAKTFPTRHPEVITWHTRTQQDYFFKETHAVFLWSKCCCLTLILLSRVTPFMKHVW